MKVSIIVPVHNAQESICKCVESIVNQEAVDVEIILVENNSTDDSLYICKKLTSDYDNILCIESREEGVSAARNKGLEIACGEVIGFCDADDFMEENSLIRVVEAFEGNVDVLVTGFYRVAYGSEEKTAVPLLKKGDISADVLIRKVLNDSRIMGSVWNKFYRASLIENIRFNRELSYCEDTYFNVKVLSNNRKCICKTTGFRTYNYVENPKSVTANMDALFDSQHRLKYINSCHQILKDCVLDIRIQKEVGYAIVGHAVNALHNLNEDKIQKDAKEILVNEIKQNLVSFLTIMWKYKPKHNVKRLIWIIHIFCVSIIENRKKC